VTKVADRPLPVVEPFAGKRSFVPQSTRELRLARAHVTCDCDTRRPLLTPSRHLAPTQASETASRSRTECRVSPHSRRPRFKPATSVIHVNIAIGAGSRVSSMTDSSTRMSRHQVTCPKAARSRTKCEALVESRTNHQANHL